MTMNIKNLKVHLALKDYEFMEFEVLGVETLKQAQELAKTLKNAAGGDSVASGSISPLVCKHDFKDWEAMSGLNAKGRWTGKRCKACRSVAFDPGGEWLPPRDEQLNMNGGEK